MISIIHPSRGRASMAQDAARLWLDKAKHPKDIEYILSLDTDDKDGQLRYYQIFFDKIRQHYKCKVKIEQHFNRNVVDAMNSGAQAATGDILVCISDDFDCPVDWDVMINYQMAGVNGKMALQVDDGTPNKERLTLPIINRSLYCELKYIYYPEYTGLFADNDLYEHCVHLGALRKVDVLFKHRHYSTIPGAKADDTHRRHNHPQGHTHGERLLKQRRLMNFVMPEQDDQTVKGCTIISSMPPHTEAMETIKSWQRFYKVVCLQSKEEIESLQQLYPDVTFVETVKTLEKLTGKKLVSINAMLDYGLQHKTNVLLINSDILLAEFPECSNDGITCFQRMDYDNNMNDNEPFVHGWDAFFIPYQFLKIYPPSIYAMGACWWDYWIPYTAMKERVPVYLKQGCAYHKKHPQQWSTDEWQLYGETFRIENKLNFTDIGKMGQYILNVIKKSFK